MSRGALRSALAMAEALLPGSGKVAPADEATVAAVEGMLGHLSPRVIAAFRAAQRTLDAAAVLATGRPFHRLSAERQDRLLTAWEDDPLLATPLYVVALVYKLAHFDRGPVYEGLGRKFHLTTQLEQPRWLEQLVDAERLELSPGEDVEAEVVVVGTGAGGAVVGKELADAGLAVCFVEEGDHHRRDAFKGSAVDAHQRFYRGAFSIGNAPMPVMVGRMVGGSTAINTGTSFRTPEWVLERWCRELGSDDFRPSRMAPYFDKVERTLGVEPAERRWVGPIADVVERGCEAMGWAHGPILRNAPGCEGTGFCDFGCPTDARRSTNLSYLPPALERGALGITGLRVTEVLLEGGRAVGVAGESTRSGKRIRVRAPVVVFAGGTIPTPLFLQKQGLALSSGQVGRNLTLHPSGGMHGVFDEPINGPHHIPQGWHLKEFIPDGILVSAAQADFNVASLMFPVTGRRLMRIMDDYDHTASFGVLIADAARNGRVWGDVGGTPAITYNLQPADVAKLHQGMVRVGEMLLAAGAKRLLASLKGFTTIEDRDDFERFRQHRPRAGDFLLTSYHPLGTCQMSRTPADGVVDLNHETHDVPGLFLVDGSVVRGPLGVNSQITIMALATRAAERIANRLS